MKKKRGNKHTDLGLWIRNMVHFLLTNFDFVDLIWM